MNGINWSDSRMLLGVTKQEYCNVSMLTSNKLFYALISIISIPSKNIIISGSKFCNSKTLGQVPYHKSKEFNGLQQNTATYNKNNLVNLKHYIQMTFSVHWYSIHKELCNMRHLHTQTSKTVWITYALNLKIKKVV